MPGFTCQVCGKEFDVRDATLAKYPGWQPKRCLSCKAREEDLTTIEVLTKYTAGPADGVFTDGAADPNPGPGGWGAVYVSTINEWAAGWEKRGWKRKDGEIKNLELVQEVYALFKRRPELTLRWIAGHSGNRWNEYADSLASAYRRTKR